MRARIAYYGGAALFCGDTLVACACGPVFEDIAEQLHAWLQREPALIDSADKHLGARLADPVRVVAATRDWKNRF